MSAHFIALEVYSIACTLPRSTITLRNSPSKWTMNTAMGSASMCTISTSTSVCRFRSSARLDIHAMKSAV
eukprot:scaffold88042_cov43-Tisochrysis_lutea.AAC.2